MRVVTDESGQVARDSTSAEERHDYYPFGAEMVAGGGMLATGSRKKFTGHERDEESGLDYMLARYNSPALGRFLSADPGFDVQNEDPQSWNQYAYVRNNPVIATDPDGKLLNVLGGALLGAAIDLGYQTFGEGKSLKQVNWVSVGVSAAAGATGVGIGSVVGKLGTTAGKVAFSVGANAALGSASNVATTVGTNLVGGKPATAGLSATRVAAAGVIGAAGGALGGAVQAKAPAIVNGAAERAGMKTLVAGGDHVAVHAAGLKAADAATKATNAISPATNVATGIASPAVDQKLQDSTAGKR